MENSFCEDRDTINIFLFDVNGIYAISLDGHFTILLLSVIYFCLWTIFVLCVKSEKFSYFIHEFYDILTKQHNPQFSWDILKRFHFKELQVATVNFSSKTILGSKDFGNFQWYVCNLPGWSIPSFSISSPHLKCQGLCPSLNHDCKVHTLSYPINLKMVSGLINRELYQRLLTMGLYYILHF